jgi:hypothetical protein
MFANPVIGNLVSVMDGMRSGVLVHVNLFFRSQSLIFHRRFLGSSARSQFLFRLDGGKSSCHRPLGVGTPKSVSKSDRFGWGLSEPLFLFFFFSFFL